MKKRRSRSVVFENYEYKGDDYAAKKKNVIADIK